jgi:hypothetical protein
MTGFKPSTFLSRHEEIASAISTLSRHGLPLSVSDKLKAHLSPHILFDGDDGLFKAIAPDISTYIEYGCGKSTEWMYRNTQARIFSVDTSRQWANAIMRLALQSEGDLDRLNVNWVDVGPVADWGLPLSFAQRDRFKDYTDWPWLMSPNADLVMIDGRFRVCCFLTSLKNAPVGTKILFDDYSDRPFYYLVEEFLPIIERCGRQALFEVTEDGKSRLSDEEIERFRYVID